MWSGNPGLRSMNGIVMIMLFNDEHCGRDITVGHRSDKSVHPVLAWPSLAKSLPLPRTANILLQNRLHSMLCPSQSN